MTKKREQQEKLLAETFHGDWSEGASAGFARTAAAAARRRHRTRRALVASGAAAGMAAAVLVSLFHRTNAPIEKFPTTKTRPAYEIISDDELIARVQDRPLLVLPQENGTKQIVMLGD